MEQPRTLGGLSRNSQRLRDKLCAKPRLSSGKCPSGIFPEPTEYGQNIPRDTVSPAALPPQWPAAPPGVGLGLPLVLPGPLSLWLRLGLLDMSRFSFRTAWALEHILSQEQ